MTNSGKTHWKNILLALTAAAVLLACGAPAGNVESGQRWYAMHNCAACHGAKADDGKALPIKNLDMGFSNFEHVLRNPYSPSMPKFSEKKLSKQDAADIYAWLKSLK